MSSDRSQNGIQAKYFSIMLGCLGISGCNVHPLPKDVSLSSTDTFSIVKNMRCEAKFEVIDQINAILSSSPSPIVRAIRARDVQKLGVLDKIHFEYEKHEKDFIDENGTRQEYLNIAETIQSFQSSAISYNFLFEITEGNLASGNAAFRLPFTNGLANISGGTSLNASRLGKRQFKMQENFSDLEKLQCDSVLGANTYFPDGTDYIGKKLPRKRLIYPLMGSVGMHDIMSNFLKLGVLGGGVGNFTDTMTFTTTKAGNAGVSVTLTPSPLKSLRLASANLSASASRQDIHEVIITLAFPKKAEFKTALERKRNAKTARTKEAAVDALKAIAKGARLEAAITQCIQRAEARENRFGVLRNTSPLAYCPRYSRELVGLLEKRKGVK